VALHLDFVTGFSFHYFSEFAAVPDRNVGHVVSTENNLFVFFFVDVCLYSFGAPAAVERMGSCKIQLMEVLEHH
jgi:hypothetical protein